VTEKGKIKKIPLFTILIPEDFWVSLKTPTLTQIQKAPQNERETPPLSFYF